MNALYLSASPYSATWAGADMSSAAHWDAKAVAMRVRAGVALWFAQRCPHSNERANWRSKMRVDLRLARDFLALAVSIRGGYVMPPAVAA